MSDERRKAAEAYADGIGARVNRMGNIVLAHMAGDEAGARREREEIVKWIVAESDRWYDPHDKANFRGIAEAIERGEHRGGG